MDLNILDIPINANNKAPGKFKYEFGSKIMDEFMVFFIKKHIALNIMMLRRKECRIELNMKTTIMG